MTTDTIRKKPRRRDAGTLYLSAAERALVRALLDHHIANIKLADRRFGYDWRWMADRVDDVVQNPDTFNDERRMVKELITKLAATEEQPDV